MIESPGLVTLDHSLCMYHLVQLNSRLDLVQLPAGVSGVSFSFVVSTLILHVPEFR